MVCEKGTNCEFRPSIVDRHFEKKVPSFTELSLVSRHIKKGTKFQLSVVRRETQIIHVISLTRKKKVPFSIEGLFLTNIEKRHHYLVSHQ